jgi:ankyrin repeat protein
VNAKNFGGMTALMIAARKGNAESVKALIAAGAYVNAKNGKGETALTLAKRYADTVALLKSAGATE